MKRIISFLLVAVMVLGCMPFMPILAAEEGKIISRYTDAVADFTFTVDSEKNKNEAGMSDEDYMAFLRDPATFAISFGNAAWKVGVIGDDGAFTPFTRVMAMIADYGAGTHDVNWASTEEAYLSRIEPYMAGGSVGIWTSTTPLWWLNSSNKTGLTSGSGNNLMPAMVYTVEKDCTVTFSFAALQDLSNHSIAILVDGQMIWPNAGASILDTSKYYTVGKNANLDIVNVALLSAAGTELKAGQQVAFVVRGGGDSLLLEPVISEFVAGQTAISVVHPYGTNETILSAPGEIYTLPAYNGKNIFLGWDTNGDGVADKQAGETVEVPNKAAYTITGCVVESSAFANSYPTYDATARATVFHDNWTLGRYVMADGTYEPFATGNGQGHIYVDTGMWGSTGGGFYLGNGMIAFSGCYGEEGPYAVSLRTTVDYSGKVAVDFDRLEGWRQLNSNEFADSTTAGGHTEVYLAYDFAIFHNGEKIFPTDGDWWHWQSDKTYNNNRAGEDMADNFREIVGELICDVTAGDTFEFRIRQGEESCWMFYCDAVLRYTELSATPRVEKVEVTPEAGEIALDFCVSTLMAEEGAVNGLLLWTAAQQNYDPATGIDLTAIAEEGGMTYFRYNGFAAKNMTDKVYVVAYSKTADETVYSNPVAYTVKDVADAMLANLTGEARNFLVSLLNYGANAQNVFGYNTNTPANESLDREEREPEFDSSALQNVYAQTGEGNKVKSVSLICGSKLGFKFMTDAVEGATAYQIEIATNADFTDSTKVDMVNAAEGSEKKAIVYIDGADLGATFYIRVLVDGQAGAVLTYSIQTYMARMMETLDDNTYYLVQSLVLLAEAYAA